MHELNLIQFQEIYVIYMEKNYPESINTLCYNKEK